MSLKSDLKKTFKASGPICLLRKLMSILSTEVKIQQVTELHVLSKKNLFHCWPLPSSTAVGHHPQPTTSKQQLLLKSHSASRPALLPSAPPEARHADKAAQPSLPPGYWHGQGETGLWKTTTSRKGNSLSSWSPVPLNYWARSLTCCYLQEMARGKGSSPISG